MSLVLLVTDCREPFMPDFETGKNDYLVIDGFINVGQKAVTSITLSRVAPLLDESQVFEDGAVLYIERKDGTLYPLHRSGNGNFKSDSLSLDPTMEYRLLITTQNDSQYASNFTTPKITPVIDSIYWRSEVDGIQMYVSAHDDENNTQYYKWDYEETWEYHSSYKSKYVYVGDSLEPRADPSMLKLYRCWQTAKPEDLRFASTQQLEEDAIKYPLVRFAHYSDRTSVKYSIFVEQRALTKEEFEYLQLIQKNSKLTGSLFDPMPSEIRGNIQSLGDANEKVIGYIGAYSTIAKRFFVSAAEFGVDPPAPCSVISVPAANFGLIFGSGNFIPVGHVSGVVGIAGAPAYCMNCALRGGVPNRPDFWEP
jgi:hypothetical protein